MNHITHINRKRELGKQLKLLVDYMPHYDSLEELEKLNLEILCITQEIKEIERLPKAVQYSLTYFKKTILKSKMNEDRIEINSRRDKLPGAKVLSNSVNEFQTPRSAKQKDLYHYD